MLWRAEVSISSECAKAASRSCRQSVATGAHAEPGGGHGSQWIDADALDLSLDQNRPQGCVGDESVSDVGVRSEQGVLEITLRRASKRNALTAAMYETLARLIESAGASDEVRAIVVAADGADFCAGNDLPEFLGNYDLGPGTPWRRFLDVLPAAPRPLVAAVQGNAVGIGMTMLLHFDVVYVEPTARLSVPFASLGVVPEAGSSVLLRELVGPIRASEAFLLGRTFDAEESVRLGLATAVVPAGTGRPAAHQAARAIAQLPGEAVRQYLKLKQTRHSTLSQRIDAECQAFMHCIRTPQTRSILAGLANTSRVGDKTMSPGSGS